MGIGLRSPEGFRRILSPLLYRLSYPGTQLSTARPGLSASPRVGDNRFSLPGWGRRNTGFYHKHLFTQFGRMAQEKVTPGWIAFGHNAWLHPRIVDDPHTCIGEGSGKGRIPETSRPGRFWPLILKGRLADGAKREEVAPVPAAWCMRPRLKVHGWILKALTFRPPLEERIRRKILYASKTLAGVNVQIEDRAPTFSTRPFSMEARRRSPRIRNSSPANSPRSF